MAVQGGNKYALTNSSVGTTATLLAPENANRKALIVRNLDASAAIYIGGSGVTTSNYLMKVLAGEPYTDTKSRDAVYAIVASGTVAVTGYYTD